MLAALAAIGGAWLGGSMLSHRQSSVALDVPLAPGDTVSIDTGAGTLKLILELKQGDP